MISDSDPRRTADLASFILPRDAYAIFSGLDEETETWSDSAAYELGEAIRAAQPVG